LIYDSEGDSIFNSLGLLRFVDIWFFGE
jgi:hypothetical protein